jgi:hypothetical protein
MFLIFGKFGLWILGGSSTSTIEYPRLSTVVVFLHLVANKRWKMMGNVIQKLLISPRINTIEYIYNYIYNRIVSNKHMRKLVSETSMVCILHELSIKCGVIFCFFVAGFLNPNTFAGHVCARNASAALRLKPKSPPMA